MAKIYAGSTPKYLIKIKDEAGVQLDPTNLDQVSKVLVYIYNSITGNVIGRFIYYYGPQAPYEGHTWMRAKDLGGGDVRLILYLTAAQTIAAEGNGNKIQITVHVPDIEVDGDRIIIKTGEFSEIVKAKS